MAKILYIANIMKCVNNFCASSMQAALDLGMEFHIAANWRYENDMERQLDEKKYGIKIHQIDFIRQPYDFRNLKAYRQVVDLIEREGIDIIHCNTPIGGVIGRLAGKKCGVKTIIYQAHGFHFYKGAPKINWLLYYPIEKCLARCTDILITINREDYEFAQKKLKLRDSGNVYYVQGVGIDVTQYYKNIDFSFKRNQLSINDPWAEKGQLWKKKRIELNIPFDAFVFISVGELNDNKNNEVVISALEKIGRKDIYYILCGEGKLKNALLKQVNKKQLSKNVLFLGYRNDVSELYEMADCFIMPSLREGLSRSIMEAMASGLPCIVSKIRGNTDLIEDGEGGFLCNTTEIDDYVNAMSSLIEDRNLGYQMGANNLYNIQNYDIKIVIAKIQEIYSTIEDKV